MKEERIKRYYEKLEYLDQTIENLDRWTKGIDVKEFINNVELQNQYGIYHAFQIAIEIITDLAAMIVRDLKLIPKDDYSNFNILKNKKVIPNDLAIRIGEANGLRNRIVHNYNGLDNKIAYESLLNLLNVLENFEGLVKKWLKENY